MKKNKRKTDIPRLKTADEVNTLQSVNAPVGLFQFYRDLAIAKFGDASKRQYFFREALTDYIERNKTEFEPLVEEVRKNRE